MWCAPDVGATAARIWLSLQRGMRRGVVHPEAVHSTFAMGRARWACGAASRGVRRCWSRASFMHDVRTRCSSPSSVIAEHRCARAMVCCDEWPWPSELSVRPRCRIGRCRCAVREQRRWCGRCGRFTATARVTCSRLLVLSAFFSRTNTRNRRLIRHRRIAIHILGFGISPVSTGLFRKLGAQSLKKLFSLNRALGILN